MGNQTTKQPTLVRKPPMLATLPRQGTGFNSYDSDFVTSPRQKAKEQFAQIITDTLKQYSTKKLEAINENVSDNDDDFNNEITFQNENIQMDTKEPEIQLSFVPKENIISNGLDINSIFEYMKQLGSGASCRVLKAKHKQNNKLYAIKELIKEHEINAQLFSEEVKLLRKLMHPNILRYYNCYMDNQCYYIATEFCDGGTMLDKIIKMKSFSEQKASQYIATILSAVNYMHNLNIVHRDLKAQNMVFSKYGIDGVLQIIDFGDSKIIKDKQIYSEFVGTIHYVAPEIVRKRTGKELKKSDLWSVGVIAYLLVCGSPPFRGTTQKQILSNIINKKNNKLLYPKGIGISKSCRNFIESLLCHNIGERLSATDALKHEWICGGTASTDNLAVEVLKSLKRYHYNNKLQDILVNAILSEMDMSERELLGQGLLDMNRNVSNMDNDRVVEYLLLHASIQKMPVSNNKNWQQKRRSEIQLFQYQSMKNLNGLEDTTDDINIGDSSQNVFVPSKVLNNDDINDSGFDVLDGIDIDMFIDAVDKKEQELEMLDDTVKINLSPTNKVQRESMHDIFDDIDDDDDEIVTDHEYEMDDNEIINKTDSLGSTASNEDKNLRRISVQRFRDIMKKSNKKYDIDDIVKGLDDGTGHIPLNKIASYTKRIKTMGNVLKMDSNKLKKSNDTLIEKSNTM